MDTKNNTISMHEVVGARSAWRWALPLTALVLLVVVFASNRNEALFYWLNGLTSHAPDTIWIHLSMFADGQFLVLFVLPFLGRRPDIVWQYFLATLLGGLYVQGLKELFSVWRPPAVLAEDSFHLIGVALQNNAFPSGHTTAAFALAALICLHQFSTRIKVAALSVAILIGLSRIANGVHWPQDVLAGAFGGWLVVMVAIWLSRHWQGGMKIWPQRIFALVLIPFAIWGVWSLKQHLDEVYPGTDVIKVLALLISLAWTATGMKYLIRR